MQVNNQWFRNYHETYLGKLDGTDMDARPPQALLTLWEDAAKFARERNTSVVQASLDAAKEKMLFFEKITLGSGAIVTAVVSFVGSQKQHLEPAWLLRSTLVIWALAPRERRSVGRMNTSRLLQQSIWKQGCALKSRNGLLSSRKAMRHCQRQSKRKLRT